MVEDRYPLAGHYSLFTVHSHYASAGQAVMQELTFPVERTPQQADARQQPRYCQKVALECSARAQGASLFGDDPHAPGFHRQRLSGACPAEYEIGAAYR